MVSYEVLAGIWLIVGCFNVLLTVDDPDLLGEPIGFVLLVCGVFLAFGPLLLLLAIWIAVEQIRNREGI